MTREEQGQALLAAILEQSDDDAVRLVYADWLEEGGQDERAEFVRLQVWLDRPIAIDSASGKVAAVRETWLSRSERARESELLRSHGDDWLGIMKRADEVVTHHVGPNHNTPD